MILWITNRLTFYSFPQSQQILEWFSSVWGTNTKNAPNYQIANTPNFQAVTLTLPLLLCLGTETWICEYSFPSLLALRLFKNLSFSCPDFQIHHWGITNLGFSYHFPTKGIMVLGEKFDIELGQEIYKISLE